MKMQDWLGEGDLSLFWMKGCAYLWLRGGNDLIHTVYMYLILVVTLEFFSESKHRCYENFAQACKCYKSASWPCEQYGL